jgi:hypothetical protein
MCIHQALGGLDNGGRVYAVQGPQQLLGPVLYKSVGDADPFNLYTVKLFVA